MSGSVCLTNHSGTLLLLLLLLRRRRRRSKKKRFTTKFQKEKNYPYIRCILSYLKHVKQSPGWSGDDMPISTAPKPNFKFRNNGRKFLIPSSFPGIWFPILTPIPFPSLRNPSRRMMLVDGSPPSPYLSVKIERSEWIALSERFDGKTPGKKYPPSVGLRHLRDNAR